MLKLIVSKNFITHLINNGYSLSADVKSKDGEVHNLVYINAKQDVVIVPVGKEFKANRTNSMQEIKLKNPEKVTTDFIKNEAAKLKTYMDNYANLAKDEGRKLD